MSGKAVGLCIAAETENKNGCIQHLQMNPSDVC